MKQTEEQVELKPMNTPILAMRQDVFNEIAAATAPKGAKITAKEPQWLSVDEIRQERRDAEEEAKVKFNHATLNEYDRHVGWPVFYDDPFPLIPEIFDEELEYTEDGQTRCAIPEDKEI